MDNKVAKIVLKDFARAAGSYFSNARPGFHCYRLFAQGPLCIVLVWIISQTFPHKKDFDQDAPSPLLVVLCPIT